MALADPAFAVQFFEYRIWLQATGISTQAHRASFIDDTGLFFHDINNRIGRVFIKLAGMGRFQTADIARIFHDCNLHPETNAQKRYILFPGILTSRDLTLYAPVTKAARYQNAVCMPQNIPRIERSDLFTLDPSNVYVDACFKTRMV